ncbi:hypothetical protein [Plantactinospora sp. KLBMP9567]|nr:hypothetical protein [Plantactinospora sp. KLBMP9567]MDW5325108.1 hypothetical protein [Plantactinospora sp. KLBMP9567]MDW5329309.1 hypothetical protein [Plantactinospora sp. KLBMP9567]
MLTRSEWLSRRVGGSGAGRPAALREQRRGLTGVVEELGALPAATAR